MMTNPTTNETSRQVLGKAIRFFREERRLTQHNLADRVGCSVGDIDDWERGKAAPPDNKWGRLCKMLHDNLSGMRVTWQRACAEEAREKAEAKSVPVGALKSRPFANLPQVLATAPPALKIVPAEPVPHTLHDDGFDLRPAYKAVAKLPEGWRTAEAIEDRRVYARGLIVSGMTNDDVYKQVRLKFNVGISQESLAELRADVRAAQSRPRPAPEAVEVAAPPPPPKPAVKELPVMPKPEPPPPAAAPTVENNIEAAVRLILEAVPNLKSFKIEVGDNGDIDVSHTIRVETTGTMKLRKP